jgi:hypothetical protein
MHLTAMQRRMLESAAEMTGKVDAAAWPNPLIGTCANDVGEGSSLRSLARRGLVVCVGYAQNVYSDDSTEISCYAITDAGRALLGEPASTPEGKD